MSGASGFEDQVKAATNAMQAAGYEIAETVTLPGGGIRVTPKAMPPERLLTLEAARTLLGGRHPAELGVAPLGRGKGSRWDRKALEYAASRRTSAKIEAPRRQRLATPKPGYVYFIQTGNPGFIKIGFSANPRNRLASIQSHCPDEVQVLLVHPGDENLELAIHRAFKEDHHRGEWFRPSWGLTQLIADLQENEAKALDDFQIKWVRKP